ncbi:hypothetical protein D3C78_1491860 [compost metagenome]
MRYFGTISKRSILNFDEIAYLNMLTQFRPRTQISERSNGCLTSHFSLGKDRLFYLYAVIDLTIFNFCPRTNDTILANNSFTRNHAIWVNDCICSNCNICTNISGAWINYRYPAQHMLLNDTFTHKRFSLR